MLKPGYFVSGTRGDLSSLRISELLFPLCGTFFPQVSLIRSHMKHHVQREFCPDHFTGFLGKGLQGRGESNNWLYQRKSRLQRT